jgi:phenylalanine-4-hydroxylase
VDLEFVSGVRVQGELVSIAKQDHSNILMSFVDCTVTGPDGETLFQPDWGQYDMAVGEHIVSVYPGSADRARFDVYPPASRNESLAQTPSSRASTEFDLYQRVRDLRAAGTASEAALREIYIQACEQAPEAWLLVLELFELASTEGSLAAELLQSLQNLGQQSKQVKLLVERGVKLLDNPSLAA